MAKIELVRDKELKISKTKQPPSDQQGSGGETPSKSKEDEESEDDQENEQNDQYVEEVEITNLRGEVERIHVNDIKPVSAELAKQLIV